VFCCGEKWRSSKFCGVDVRASKLSERTKIYCMEGTFVPNSGVSVSMKR
jgi:hypothetical protein